MNAELKPNQILNHLEASVADYVKKEGGKITAANDAFAIVEILGEASPSFRVILLWEGDEDATGQPLAGIVNNNVAVIVSHNRGLRMWRGDSVYKDSPARKSLLTLVDEIRARVRACVVPPRTS